MLDHLQLYELEHYCDTTRALGLTLVEGTLLANDVKRIVPYTNLSDQRSTSTQMLLTRMSTEVGLEGIVKNIFLAVIQFFKNIISGIYNFIKSALGFHDKISDTNESLIKKLRPVMDAHKDELSKIPAANNIPMEKDLTDTINKLQKVMSQLVNVNILEFDTNVSKLLDAKDESVSEELSFVIDYSKVFGTSDYTSYLTEVGITFEDDRPSFKSVFTDERTDTKTVGALGYDYTKLSQLNTLTSSKLEACKSQLEKNCGILEKISSKLTNFSNTENTAKGTRSAPYKKILDELPGEISKLIGLYHVAIQGSVVYATKITEIIKTLYSNISSYTTPTETL